MKVKPAGSLDPEILVRVQEGVCMPPFTPKAVKKFCIKHEVGIRK
jgi:hypothetical protein